MKPLVFHIRASNFFGGPERQIIGHIQSSTQFDHLVVTFREANAENEFEHVCRQRGVDVAGIATAHAYQWSAVRQLKSLIAERRPALLCCHGYKPLVLSLLARWRARIPVLAFSRGHTAENLKIRLFEAVELQLYSWADLVVAVSQGYGDMLIRRGLSAGRLTVVRNAVDLGKFVPHIAKKAETRHALGFTENDFLIATAGRLSPEKAQSDLVTAFTRLGKHQHPLHLVICGDGPMREKLEEQAVSLGLRNVHFLGHREDIDALMPIFDLFVLPSLTEGLPNVLLEAASCNVPIVATKVGGVPEVVTDGESALLVEPGNSGQLAEAIERCLVNPQRTARFAECAYRTVAAQYGFARQTRELEGVYSRLLEQYSNG